MRTRVNRWSSLVVGMAAGIALVVSCGDQMKHGAADADMSVGDSNGSCSGTCTVAGPIALQQPVSVTATDALPVSGAVTVSGAVAVSGIDAPVKVSGPVDVTVAGPLKVLTADSDAHQLQGGVVAAAAGSWILIAKGPFVLTDLALQYPTSTASPRIAVTSGSDCTNAQFAIYWLGFTAAAPVHGGRMIVPNGSVACATTEANQVVWSGFAPY